MSQRTKKSGKSLTDQAARGKVVGKTIVSVKKETNVERNPNKNRLIKLGVAKMIEELFDEDNAAPAFDYINSRADYLYKQETIFEPKYIVAAILETLAAMVDVFDEAVEYINSLSIDELILSYQMNEYLGELATDDVINYVLVQHDYFDPNTFEGKNRLIEYCEYVHEHQGDISGLSETDTFELDAPTENVKELKRYVAEMQESVMVTRGVTNLGYCTDCNVNVLIVDEIQDRSGDEQKSIYISCSKCHKRGGNIRYYTEGEYDELASQASSSPSSSSSSM